MRRSLSQTIPPLISRMASLLMSRSILLRGLQLSQLRIYGWFKGQRGLITGADIQVADEFLLQEHDLPPVDQDYFKLISQDEFVGKYGKNPHLLKIMGPNEISLRQIATVLPLHVSGTGVVPIPFIVDTGTPEVMYLGSGSVAKLKELKLIRDVTAGVHIYCLMGTLFNQEEMASLDQPLASALPIHFEEASVRGDPRINFLGLRGIKLLKVPCERTIFED